MKNFIHLHVHSCYSVGDATRLFLESSMYSLSRFKGNDGANRVEKKLVCFPEVPPIIAIFDCKFSESY